MSNQAKKIITLLTFILFLSMSLFSGCKGSDTREKVDDTVEEFAGKKQVDRMKEMQKDIGNITEKESERMNDLYETDSEEDE